MIYSTLIIPHLNYCVLVWASRVLEGHKPVLLQTKALRIFANDATFAHV